MNGSLSRVESIAFTQLRVSSFDLKNEMNASRFMQPVAYVVTGAENSVNCHHPTGWCLTTRIRGTSRSSAFIKLLKTCFVNETLASFSPDRVRRWRIPKLTSRPKQRRRLCF